MEEEVIVVRHRRVIEQRRPIRLTRVGDDEILDLDMLVGRTWVFLFFTPEINHMITASGDQQTERGGRCI